MIEKLKQFYMGIDEFKLLFIGVWFLVISITIIVWGFVIYMLAYKEEIIEALTYRGIV